MGITVRALGPEDAEAYVELRRAMLVDTPHAFLASPESDFASDAGRLRETLAGGPDQTIFGAFEDGLVGAVGCYRDRHPKAAHKLHVWGVFVAPRVRGQGVGRRLMEVGIAHARTVEGVTQLNLSVSADTPHARSLYEAVGFRVWGSEPRAMVVDGRVHGEVHMLRALDDA